MSSGSEQDEAAPDDEGQGRGSGIVITMGDVFKMGLLNPDDNHRQRTFVQPVPEESKDEKYYASRLNNTMAARKCRAKKRNIDEIRVEIIKRQKERIRELERRAEYLQRFNELCRVFLVGIGRLNEAASAREERERQDDQ